MMLECKIQSEYFVFETIAYFNKIIFNYETSIRDYILFCLLLICLYIFKPKFMNLRIVVF